MQIKKFLPALLLSFSLTSCAFIHKMDVEQGNIVTEDNVNLIHVGMTEAQIKNIMGTPVLINTFADNRISYVYTFKPGHGKLIERRITLTFRNGRLANMSGNM